MVIIIRIWQITTNNMNEIENVKINILKEY